MRRAFFILVALTLGPIRSVLAVDQFEIQVYDSEINKAGVYTLENHVNYVISGLTNPTYPGQIPYNHLLHVTQEFARGMSEFWELGFYYQSAVTFPADYRFGGIKLRSKFVIPLRISGSFQLGANFELSDVQHGFENSQYALEIRPILGYTLDPVTILVNPILSFSLSGQPASDNPAFAPAVKLMWDTKKHVGLGVEYYGEIGPLNDFPGVSMQEHYLYGVFDLLDEDLELNFGVGKGLTNASNDTVVKTIIGFKLYR